MGKEKRLLFVSWVNNIADKPANRRHRQSITGDMEPSLRLRGQKRKLYISNGVNNGVNSWMSWCLCRWLNFTWGLTWIHLFRLGLTSRRDFLSDYAPPWVSIDSGLTAVKGGGSHYWFASNGVQCGNCSEPKMSVGMYRRRYNKEWNSETGNAQEPGSDETISPICRMVRILSLTRKWGTWLEPLLS